MVKSNEIQERAIHIGKWLIAHREALQISQDLLARQLGYSQSHIAKIERAQQRITLVEFIQWSLTLGISFEDVSIFLNELYLDMDSKSLWLGDGDE